MQPVYPVSLNLDKRQRAMLLEMGVHVWQPEAPVAEFPPAREAVAADAASAAGDGVSHQQETKAFDQPLVQREALPPQAAPRPVSPPVVPRSQPARLEAKDGSAPAAWLLGQAQVLYADTAQAGGARWLVLAETPAAVLHGPVFQGDAGQLLDNMLRAARLNRAGAVQFAPLVRQGAAAATPEFLAALAALVAQAQPDVVLVMGRLAALALLPTGEPFGKLRGRAHALHGASAIVTYDAPYLLRTPADKGKAWADLCLAMSLTAAAT